MILGVVPAPIRGRQADAVFVGRERECAAWMAMLAGLREGGAVLVLAGEPGIGKSRLQRHLNTLATKAGLRVLRMQCRSAGTGSAYRPLVEALAPLARPGGPLAGDVPEAYRSALSSLSPLWEPGASSDRTDGSLAVAESVVRILSLLAGGGGLVVAVDDVQWADPDTFAVLEHLARTVDTAPVALTVTARTEPSAAPRIGTLADSPAATALHLDRLDDAAARQLIAALLGDGAPQQVVDFVSTRAEGLPLAIEELLSDLLRNGALDRAGGKWVVHGERLQQATARSIDAAVEVRLGQIDQDAVAVAVAVALRDEESTWDDVAAITGQHGDRVAAALQSLASVDLLASVGRGRFRYRHGLIRAAVLAAAPPSVVEALARRAAAGMSEETEVDPDRLAWAATLWELVGDADAASRAHVGAARRWLALGAAATAEITARAAADQAVSAPVRADALDALSEALTRMGRFADALPLLDELLVDAATPTGGRTAFLHCRAARCATETGDPAAAARHLDEAERVGGAEHEACALRATLAFEARDAVTAAQLARQAIALAEAADDPQALGSALLIQARVLRAGDPEDALPGLERLVELARTHALPGLHEQAVLELGLVDRLTTNRTDRLEEAQRLAVERGSLHTRAVAESNLWPGLLEHGDLDRAQRLCFDSVEIADRHRLRTAQPAAAMAVMHEAMRGRFASAAAFAERLQGTMFEGGAGFYLELLRGDADAALAAIAPSAQAISAAPDARAAPARGLHALLAAAVRGDPGPAALVSGVGVGARYNRGLVRLAEAVIAGGRGDRAEADLLAADGYRQLHPYPTLAAIATSLCAQPAIADGWGEPASWLDAARDHFGWLGNDVMRRSCDAMLRAAGLPVRRRGRGDSEVPPHLRRIGITSREMDVLLLVAEHLTNAQIAERLCLSPRTVDTHVSRLIAKAQVPGRTGLLDLVDPLVQH